MIYTIEWFTNTAGCGGAVALTVFASAIVVYTLALRWLKHAGDPREDKGQ